MKIAISTDGGQVSAHFGRCPSFTLVEIKNGEVIDREEISNPGHRTNFLPNFLRNQGVNLIVAGGMGWRAENLFQESDVKTIVGVQGSIESVIKQLSKGTLKTGESLCSPGNGKGYGVAKEDHDENHAD